MKPILELDEIAAVLAMLGSISAGPYRDLPARLMDLAVEVVPDGQLQGAGFAISITCSCAHRSRKKRRCMRAFCSSLARCLMRGTSRPASSCRSEQGSGALRPYLPILAAGAKSMKLDLWNAIIALRTDIASFARAHAVIGQRNAGQRSRGRAGDR